MNIASLIQLAALASTAAARITDLLSRCIREGRDPTEAELRDIKARQAAADAAWATLAPKEKP